MFRLASRKYLRTALKASASPANYQNSGKPLSTIPVSLRGFYGPILDQGAEGSCTAFAALQFRAALRKQAGLSWIDPSEQAQYYEERVLQNTVNQDSGATLEEALQVLETHGVLPAQDDPYTPQDFTTEPPNDWNTALKLDPGQVQKIQTEMVNGIAPPLLADTLDALDNGHPVYFAFYCFEGIESPEVAQTGILPMPGPSERLLGGHAVNSVGHDPVNQRILVLNQWGENWGIKSPAELQGCFWMPYEYYERYCTDAYVGFPDAAPQIGGDNWMQAIDCCDTLTPTSASALKSSGMAAVGRYLGFKTRHWSKSISPDEAKVIHDAGLSLVLIWESNPTFAGYFSYGGGVYDAQVAAEEADWLGADEGTAIYFTVDYDAQSGDMGAIVEYFRGIREAMRGRYAIGVYGSYAVMQALKSSAYAPDKYWQTYAWSGGQVFQENHIYQYSNDVTLDGMAVDRDQIQNLAGTWPELGGENVKNAVMYFSVNDFSVGKIVSDKLGGCAMFCRNANNANIHPDAKAAGHLVVVGGAPVTDRANVTNCCGADAAATAILAAQYAQTL